MIIVPEEYIAQKIHESVYKVTYSPYNKTFNGCCPFCKEGKSWGKKKRFFYIIEKELAYCHNCGYSKKSLNFLCDLTQNSLQEIINDIKRGDFNVLPVDIQEENETKEINLYTLPQDCINLSDKVQVDYYKDNPAVIAALHVLKTRRLHTAINRPFTFYISLNDKVHKNRLVLPFYDFINNIIFYQSRCLLNKDLKDKPKYLSKVRGEKSVYGIHNIDSKLNNVYIFEGPIDSYFVKNGLAVCGIQENSTNSLTELQNKQLNSLIGMNRVWCLDNQWCDRSSINKSLILADQEEQIFIWPEELRKIKDINELCIITNRDSINNSFIDKNTFTGLKAKVLLTKIKNNS